MNRLLLAAVLLAGTAFIAPASAVLCSYNLTVTALPGRSCTVPQIAEQSTASSAPCTQCRAANQPAERISATMI